jgi:hypothetical protein
MHDERRADLFAARYKFHLVYGINAPDRAGSHMLANAVRFRLSVRCRVRGASRHFPQPTSLTLHNRRQYRAPEGRPTQSFHWRRKPVRPQAGVGRD